MRIRRKKWAKEELENSKFYIDNPNIYKNNWREKFQNGNKKLYVEEVNSIPWCFSHHLWEARNISYKEMLNIMFEDAIAVEVKHQGMINTIDTDVIKNMTNAKLKEMK